LIVGNADGDSTRFTASFEKLGHELFPYEFRRLPADHIIFNRQFVSRNWTSRQVVSGLSNGARELMLLLSDDPAAAWQSDRFVARWLGGAQLATNIAGYATDWKFKSKEDCFAGGQTPTYAIGAGPSGLKLPPKPEKEINELRREFATALHPVSPLPDPAPATKSVTVALISTNSDPAALPPFDALRATMLRKNTTLNIDPLVLGKWKMMRYETARIAAEQLGSLDPLQRLEFKRFVETGGTLLIDASSRPNQAAAAEGQLDKIFIDPKLKFDASTRADRERFHLSRDIRIGSFNGRPAIIINDYGSLNDFILEGLLSGKAK
jgi:hypothetical protein